MKICIVTLADHRMRQMGDLTADNKRTYAKRHGYGFEYYTNLPDPSLAGTGPGCSSWNKILAVREQLADYDWVFWSDADALILNFDKRLEELIGDRFLFWNGKDLIIGRDSQPLINAGNFFFAKSQYSMGFLEQLLKHTWVGREGYHYWEQGAITYLLERQYGKNKEGEDWFVDYRSMREFNSYADFLRRPEDLAWMKPDLYQPGDFVCHFSGISFRENENNYDAVIAEMKRMIQ